METNIYVLLWAALIPSVVGSVWYHPKLMGKMVIEDNGITTDDRNTLNKILRVLLSYVIGLLIAYTLMGLSIHQLGVLQALSDQPGFSREQGEAYQFLQNFMADYGNEFRNYSHGLLHGFAASISFALPIIASIAIYEKKGWKFVCVHSGYWTISLTLMSGLISHFF